MSLYFEKYHLFANLLVQMREELARPQAVDTQKLRQTLISLKEFFREEILSAKTDMVDDSSQTREQSYLTEISKQMRLLEMDITFFQGARQAATRQNRINSMCERLNILIKYCHDLTQKPEKENSQSHNNF